MDSRRSLLSRAGSRANTPAKNSARTNRRARRNIDIIIKRVETRSRVIKKALREIKNNHPTKMSIESLKNCIVRYKLPLSEDAVQMLFEHAKSTKSLTEGSQQRATMLDLEKTVVSGRGGNFSFRSINITEAGEEAVEKLTSQKNGSTDRIISLLQESIFPKVKKLLELVSAAKFNRLKDPKAIYLESKSYLEYLKIPFDNNNLQNIFSVGAAASVTTSRLGEKGKGVSM